MATVIPTLKNASGKLDQKLQTNFSNSKSHISTLNTINIAALANSTFTLIFQKTLVVEKMKIKLPDSARVCGGQSGPKFQQHNFFDAVGALARYADNTCPKNIRNKRHRKCKIEGNEEFFDIDHEIMALVFETDSNTSKDHTGFRIEWDVYDRPDPTPTPPSNMAANVLQRWTSTKLTHNVWGIFRFAHTYVTCSQQQIKSKQCHNRHKIQRANRGKHRFIDAQRLLTHTQNY